jgi:plasmid stability protein
MAKMIQLRNVPDALHRTLKARAALAGMSLSDFLVREIRKAAERPTAAELSERLEGRSAVRTRTSPAAVLRAERNHRDRR